MATTKRRPRRTSPKSRKPATTRLVGYVRVSTDEQATEGVSLDAQRDRLNAYAKAHGYSLVAVEADEGVSGTKPPHQRPGLSAALDAVAAGKAEGVVATALDRFSRRSLDAIELMERAEREEWIFSTVKEALDTSTPSGRMVATVLVALAQNHRDEIAAKTSEAMRYLAREGRIRGRFVPFGQRIEGFPDALKVDDIPEDERPKPMRLVDHPAEQTVLMTFLDLRDEGMGPRRIAKAMNAEGGGNPRTGKPWTFGNVQRILAAYDRVTEAVEEAPR